MLAGFHNGNEPLHVINQSHIRQEFPLTRALRAKKTNDLFEFAAIVPKWSDYGERREISGFFDLPRYMDLIIMV